MEGQGGSITHWLGDLRGGDLAAAQPLWERYFGRLVVLARGKLERQRHPRAEADEEDAPGDEGGDGSAASGDVHGL